MAVQLDRVNDKYLFELTNKNGHQVFLDRKYSPDYNVKGVSPMELLLMGVAGCSSIDIISILEKQKLKSLLILLSFLLAKMPSTIFLEPATN